jgi:hypothetical protein
MGATAMKLEPKRPAVPLDQRGRIMYVRDIQNLIGRDEETNLFRKSTWWILNRFAPDKKKKMGRTPYWWEKDVIEALDSENFG